MSDTTIQLMGKYMDDTIELLKNNNGIGSIDPIYYLQKSSKSKLYL